ncbi:MAG: DUF3617 family protein [Desulfuromonadaceae bacterium]|nr:DUF3617 family protein [Desulfuromonadaceae bacterium]
MRPIVFPILLAFFLLPLPVSGQSYPEVNMKEGLWEITSEFKMPGMPMAIPPMTHQQCISKKDLANAMNQAGQENQQCRTANLTIKDDKVTYDIECGAGENATRGHAVFAYSSEKMTGTMKTSGPQGMETTTNFTGRRIGDCR